MGNRVTGGVQVALYDDYNGFLEMAAQNGIDQAIAAFPTISPADADSLRVLGPNQLTELRAIHGVIHSGLDPAQIEAWQCNGLC